MKKNIHSLFAIFISVSLLHVPLEVLAQEKYCFPASLEFAPITFSALKKQGSTPALKTWKDFTLENNKEELLRKKHFWRAGAEWFLIQAFPAAFNRFITKDPYSYISFKNFFNHQRLSAWAWDDNQFSTNHFDHPYHGQLYFNAFRSNGYNLWQSSVATFAGSYLWETGGETQSPSINDLINTTFGGIVLGEMLHRVSRNIISRGRNGENRNGNEVTAFLINPMNGLNRMLDGDLGTVDEYYQADSSSITASFDIGLRRFDTRLGDLFTRGKTSISARLRIHYSNGEHNYKRPFDQFDVNFEVGNGDSTFINAVNVHAMLYGWEFFSTKRSQYYSLITANYDFYNNDAFFYGAQSVNYNLHGEYDYRNSSLKTNIAGGLVLLAAVPDPYLLFGESRNYNYGSGLSYRFSGELNIDKRLLLSADYNGGIFHTLSGNDSYYFLNALRLEANVKLYQGFSLAFNTGYFSLHGRFKDPELMDFDREFPFLRVAIGYNYLF